MMQHEKLGSQAKAQPYSSKYPSIGSSRLKYFVAGMVSFSLVAVKLNWLGNLHARLRFSDIYQTESVCSAKYGEFDWQSLKPSHELLWVPCFDNVKLCARFEVPLDYNDPENQERAAIAMVKIPAKVHQSSTDYRGPVLFNPGGPGAPGIELIQSFGHLFQEVLGPQYDIIGFDPRGIGHTTPIVSVFGTNKLEKARWEIQAETYPLVNETSGAIERITARSRLFNQLVHETNDYVAQFSSTPVVAKDMLSIVKAHGRDKLLYWGFSYGTILGLTYASMFPENIERMIVDGVADLEGHYGGKWTGVLTDADSILGQAFLECSKSPRDCALYESDPESVKARFNAIISSVKKRPIPAHNGTFAQFINYKKVQKQIFHSLYRPYRTFKPLFEALAGLEQEDGTKFLSLLQPTEPALSCDCDNKSTAPYADGPERGLAVYCAESSPLKDTPEDLYRLFEVISEESMFADVWMDIAMACIGWGIKPKWRFEGPVGANISFPILFIGNVADPVTPLWGAKKMLTYFPGSALLTQDSIGHCSIAGTSPCTYKSIRNYFQKGELPDPDTQCEVLDSIFGNEEVVDGQRITEEERSLGSIARQLSDVNIRRFW